MKKIHGLHINHIPSDLKHSIEGVGGQPFVHSIHIGKFYPCRHSHPRDHLEYHHDVLGGIVLRGYIEGGSMDLYVYAEPNKLDELKEYANDRSVA